jgi:CBS-domain-containing membrane protein
MSSQYKMLEHGMLDAETTFHRPQSESLPKVTVNDPAIQVMTDFTKVGPVTINPCASLDNATERMIASGVRLLMVTNQYNQLLGIVTARDLDGQKIMTYLSEHGGKRDDMMVRDVMTPQVRIEVLDMADVSHARVGDIVTTLKGMGRQHALVVEHDENGRQIIRGLLSATQIGKQLGMEIDTADVANTIAGLAAVVGQS